MLNEETIGDLVESLIGYYYNPTITHNMTFQGPAAIVAVGFIRTLELACFSRWAATFAAQPAPPGQALTQNPALLVQVPLLVGPGIDAIRASLV